MVRGGRGRGGGGERGTEALPPPRATELAPRPRVGDTGPRGSCSPTVPGRSPPRELHAPRLGMLGLVDAPAGWESQFGGARFAT